MPGKLFGETVNEQHGNGPCCALRLMAAPMLRGAIQCHPDGRHHDAGMSCHCAPAPPPAMTFAPVDGPRRYAVAGSALGASTQ